MPRPISNQRPRLIGVPPSQMSDPRPSVANLIPPLPLGRTVDARGPPNGRGSLTAGESCTGSRKKKEWEGCGARKKSPAVITSASPNHRSDLSAGQAHSTRGEGGGNKKIT